MFRRAILRERSFVSKTSWIAVAVVVPTVLRWSIDRGTSGIPFVSFFPAVLLVAVILGWESAAATAAISAIVANRLLREEPLLLYVSGRDALLVSLFLISCVFIIWVGQTLRRVIKEQELTRVREEELKRELIHRGKNVFAVVQSLASLTSLHSDSEYFVEAFIHRLEALSTANHLLESVDVALSEMVDANSVVEKAIGAFRGKDNIVICGQRVDLPGSVVVPLSLALHELCTNAVKHGALSRPEGRVTIEWRASKGSELRICWQETGGPTVVEPTRRGMGTLLLRPRQGLKDVQLQFHERGVECILIIDLHA